MDIGSTNPRTNLFPCQFQELIQYLMYTCPAHLYATSISPPAAQQIISAIRVILGEDGSSRGRNITFSLSKIAELPLDFTFGSSFFSCNLRRLFCVNLGAQKLARIRENSNFFRSELQKMGFEVLGDNDSPVMPIMLYNPAKIPAFSRECLKQNVSLSQFQLPINLIFTLKFCHSYFDIVVLPFLISIFPVHVSICLVFTDQLLKM